MEVAVESVVHERCRDLGRREQRGHLESGADAALIK
jgi:hypothetical protein